MAAKFTGKMIVVLACALVVSCAIVPQSEPTARSSAENCQVDRSEIHEGMLGTLWVQTSAEYFISARATYSQATKALDALVADSDHTATGQKPPFADKPPAVIMDIDETVLDNSPFQAQLILHGTQYSPTAWSAWTSQARAQWIPGAREFIDFASSRDVAVFFVTNRGKKEENNTRANFSNLHHLLPLEPDYLLTKGEQATWTSDKSSRREYIGNDYRIVMMVGDDLNDFVSARETPDQRREIAHTVVEHFGVDWFLLPNPLYGSWEQALYQPGDDCDVVDQKRRRLINY